MEALLIIFKGIKYWFMLTFSAFFIMTIMYGLLFILGTDPHMEYFCFVRSFYIVGDFNGIMSWRIHLAIIAFFTFVGIINKFFE